MSNEVDGQFSVVPQWLMERQGIGRMEIALYAVLDSYADSKTRKAYPSVRLLAERLGMSSRKTVREALDRLARHGAIEIGERRQHRAPNAWTSNLYTVHRASPESRGFFTRWTPPATFAEDVCWQWEKPQAAKELIVEYMERSGHDAITMNGALRRLLEKGQRLNEDTIAANIRHLSVA